MLKVITGWLLLISWVGYIVDLMIPILLTWVATGFIAETLNRFLVISFFRVSTMMYAWAIKNLLICCGSLGIVMLVMVAFKDETLFRVSFHLF